MKTFPCSFGGLAASLLFSWALAAGSFADDFKIKSELVWGTNETKPADKNQLTELSPKVCEKLRHLRWKNYYVVKVETIAVPHKVPKRISLSGRCAIDVKDKGDGNIEVRIYNVTKAPDAKTPDAKPVHTATYPIQKLKEGHTFVYAGDSKDNWDDAWLVIITSGE